MREWEVTFNSGIVSAVHRGQVVGNWLDHTWQRRAYRSAFEWLPPDPSLRDEAELAPNHRVLCIDGERTHWSYYEHDGRFVVFDDNWEIALESREDAERIVVLLYDRANGPFGRERGADREIYVDHRPLDARIAAPSRRFVATRDIPDAFVRVGTRPTNASYGSSRIHEGVHERVSLPEGTEIIVTPAGWYAAFGGLRCEVAFEEPPGSRAFLKDYSGAERDRLRAFPASSLREATNSRDDIDRVFGLPQREQARYSPEAPRILEPGQRAPMEREAEREL